MFNGNSPFVPRHRTRNSDRWKIEMGIAITRNISTNHIIEKWWNSKFSFRHGMADGKTTDIKWTGFTEFSTKKYRKFWICKIWRPYKYDSVRMLSRAFVIKYIETEKKNCFLWSNIKKNVFSSWKSSFSKKLTDKKVSCTTFRLHNFFFIFVSSSL